MSTLEYKGEKHDSMSQMEIRWAALVRLRERADNAEAETERLRGRIARALKATAIEDAHRALAEEPGAKIKVTFDAPPEAVEEFKDLLRKHGVEFKEG